MGVRSPFVMIGLTVEPVCCLQVRRLGAFQEGGG